MKAADFRRIALSLQGAIEGSHMGAADFRVGGRIFATLASEKQGFGNLMLTPEVQADGEEWAQRISGWPRQTRIYWREPCGLPGSCA
jgi:hypothetical protein